MSSATERSSATQRRSARDARIIAREAERKLQPGDFPGGIYPPHNKAQSTAEPIGQIPLAEDLIVPLNQHIGAGAIPLVKLGQRVLKGEKIAEADGLISCPVHAPGSGKVVAIEPQPIAHPSGMLADCIVIRTDAEQRWCQLNPCEDFRSLETGQLLEKIRDCGIAGLGGAGFPTAVKLAPRGNCAIDTLIINGSECEPYISADDMLMRERAEEIIAGVEILAHLLDEPESVLIGIEDDKPEAIAAMRRAVRGSRFNVVAFPTKYPSGGEKQLIQILTRREVPNSGLPANVGVVCHNVGTAHAVYRAVVFGEPLISRVTTVAGEALGQQRNVELPIGTPVAHVLDCHGVDRQQLQRVVIGGPMMGYSIDNESVPVIKTTNCILAPTRRELPPAPPAQDCIRCGLCAEVCPASLLPQQLYWYARADEREKLQAYNLFDCIECGACSYVCPSSIPLVQYYRAAKGAIRLAEEEKEKSDRARERFEYRKLRLARAEQAKEAKRQARKRAAEIARQQRPAPQNGAEREQDMVAAALARVKARQAAPEQQLARAERTLTSAEHRLARIQKKLSEAATDQQATLQAQLKEAQVKLREARDRHSQIKAAAAKAPAPVAEAGQLTAAIDALQKRVATAEARLKKARTENDPDSGAYEAALHQLRQKLADRLRQQQTDREQ